LQVGITISFFTKNVLAKLCGGDFKSLQVYDRELQMYILGVKN
jgi:hypothetical protein